MKLVGQFFADLSFDSRKRAQRTAERLEALAVDWNLDGREYSGTIATEVVQRDDGSWTVKIDYLSAPGGKWRPITVFEDGNEGEEWKG
jgi:hypothetical protein